MKLDNLTKSLLEKIANLHKIPDGAFSFRKNGKSEVLQSSPNIEIKKKADLSGIDIFIKSSCQNESCHIPVVITEDDITDLVYNDFYIEDGANVVIVAGCGVHSSGESSHNGIHTFHVGKNAHVVYEENHLAVGKGRDKSINPTTILKMKEGSVMIMNTTQIGGVDSSNRITKATLANDATLEVNEKILTERFNLAKTDFAVELKGANSKCTIVSRSVAKDESEQIFKSNLIGKNSCYGRVECDGILLDNACIISQPKVSAKNNMASLSHEASIGKIAKEQLIKLMTLGLTEQEAEAKIIEGFLK